MFPLIQWTNNFTSIYIYSSEKFYIIRILQIYFVLKQKLRGQVVGNQSFLSLFVIDGHTDSGALVIGILGTLLCRILKTTRIYNKNYEALGCCINLTWSYFNAILRTVGILSIFSYIESLCRFIVIFYITHDKKQAMCQCVWPQKVGFYFFVIYIFPPFLCAQYNLDVPDMHYTY